MLSAKTTVSAGAALALASNKPVSPSVLSVSVKQAPAACVVLAVDGKRTVATRAAVVGRGDFSGDDDDLEPRAGTIKKMAEETSALLMGLYVPWQSAIAEQASFSKEAEALKMVCNATADGAAVDEDGAITVLLGIHARIKILLASQDKQTPEEFLVSSMSQTKMSVQEYMLTQAKPMVVAGQKRATWLESIDKMSLNFKPDPTVCSPEEVKLVLKKTVELLEDVEPVYSPRGMAGAYLKLRSVCRTLLHQVEKDGVEDKTRFSIVLLHSMVLGTLGQIKKPFDYQDAADDPLMASLRRLEVALREYEMGGLRGHRGLVDLFPTQPTYVSRYKSAFFYLR